MGLYHGCATLAIILFVLLKNLSLRQNMSGRSVTVGSDERTQRRRIPLIAERVAQLPVRADAGVDGMRVLAGTDF